MNRITIIIACLLNISAASVLFGKSVLVSNLEEFNKAKMLVAPGDTIRLKNGEWKDAVLIFDAHGTKEKPVYLLSETHGKVVLTGKSGLKISGEHIMVEGLLFLNANIDKNPIIEFRTSKGKLAFNSRVSNCVLDNCNPDNRLTESHWVILYGQNNRFDHNNIMRKKNLGTTLIVELNDEKNQNNNHLIDHNYFGPKERMGSNGGETIRVGTSTFSRTSSKTVIEWNYFEKCNGEVEIISVKSCDNILRKNTFFECEGSLVLRHGNRNLVEDNYFFGNGKIHTGGVRIINAGHTVKNNVFVDLEGERFRSALTVLNGVPNSPINRYDQVKNVLVSGNVFIDCKDLEWCAGKDFERTARPENIRFENNILYSSSVKTEIIVNDTLDGFSFKNNITNSSAAYPKKSFVNGMVSVKKDGDQYALSANGKTSILKAFANGDNAGVGWKYDRKSKALPDGKRIHVVPGENTLSAAVKISAINDTLVLETGKIYFMAEPVITRIPLTIMSEGATLQFSGEKPIDFFQIENGGSLNLFGLKMIGTSPNGIAGSFITAGNLPMIEHYNLFVKNCTFLQLTDSRKHAFQSGKGSFADTVSFTNCVFDDITGDLIEMAAEKDDVGRYNAEFVIFNNCLFKNVLYGCINIYRGGNDESTTGPFVYLNHCTFDQNSNTELGYAVKLYGVQFSDIRNCVFNNSGRAGRVVWYEDFGWTKHTLNYCDFNVAGKVTSFYPGIVGKNNLYVNPYLSAEGIVTNKSLFQSGSDKKSIGYKKQ